MPMVDAADGVLQERAALDGFSEESQRQYMLLSEYSNDEGLRKLMGNVGQAVDSATQR